MRKLLAIIIILIALPASAIYKNVASQKVAVFAYNISSATYATGDAANITAKISKDGGAATATDDPNPTEIGNGIYVFELTQNETNADLIIVSATSATANIIVDPAIVYAMTPERGTDSAFLAASWVAPSNATTELIYTEVAGLDGEAMRGTDSAMLASSYTAPANATVELIYTETAGLDGAAMRGTDNAFLAASWVAPSNATTELIYTEVAGLNGAAMRGTDNAMLAASYTAPSNATVELIYSEVANIDGDSMPDISGLSTFDSSTDTVTASSVINGVTIQGTIQTLDALDTALDLAHGDGSWEGAGAAPSATDIWTYTTRTLTDFDEDNMEIDLDATTIGTAKYVDGFSTNSITADTLHTSAITEIQSGLALSASILDATEVADAVWDALIAGHLDAGSTGAKLNSAAAAGDPLDIAVPGSYEAGTAGYEIGRIPDLFEVIEGR